MGPAETLQLLVEAESNFPVERWTLDGVRIWPLVRATIGYAATAQASGGDAGSPPARLARATADMLLDWKRTAGIRLKQRPFIQPIPRQGTVALLGDGVSRVNLAGEWYDRLIEPIAELAESLGRTTVHLEPQYRLWRPCHRPSRFIQPAIDAALLAARLNPPRRRKDLDGYPDFTAMMRSAGLSVVPLEQELVHRQIRGIRYVSGYFERLLRRVQAPAGFFVDRATVPLSFILACDRVGIPSIEIQHGLQGPAHWAYARWTKVPADGFELLPDLFWCWEGRDKQVIDEWTASTKHRAFVGGYLWLMKWLDGQESSSIDHEVAARIARIPHGPVVLATCQTGFVADLIEVLSDLPVEGALHIRMHPTMDSTEREQVIRFGASRGIDPEDIVWTTDVPLFALLKHIDVHLTHSSTTVIEAAAFGVPSVVVAPEFLSEFPDDVLDGWVVPAQQGSVAASIRIAAAAPRPRRNNSPSIGDARKTLEALLDQASSNSASVSRRSSAPRR